MRKLVCWEARGCTQDHRTCGHIFGLRIQDCYQKDIWRLCCVDKHLGLTKCPARLFCYVALVSKPTTKHANPSWLIPIHSLGFLLLQHIKHSRCNSFQQIFVKHQLHAQHLLKSDNKKIMNLLVKPTILIDFPYTVSKIQQLPLFFFVQSRSQEETTWL